MFVNEGEDSRGVNDVEKLAEFPVAGAGATTPQPAYRDQCLTSFTRKADFLAIPPDFSLFVYAHTWITATIWFACVRDLLVRSDLHDEHHINTFTIFTPYDICIQSYIRNACKIC